ncbi:MAG: hypothetical protein GY788_04850, partial [bacterium]|nr:hypothetical protein [bacterium]
EDTVYTFLDCGGFEQGFARVRCPDCRAEFLVATSCKRRGFCASCAAKRAAIFGLAGREPFSEKKSSKRSPTPCGHSPSLRSYGATF